MISFGFLDTLVVSFFSKQLLKGIKMKKSAFLALFAMACGVVFAQATAPKYLSIAVGADKLDRATNVKILTERFDGFKYARTASFNTNAPIDDLTFTVKKEHEGTWHIFMKVRSGASKPLDQNAAMATVLAPTTNGFEVVAKQHVTGSLGDEAWQIVSLGVNELKAGMKIKLSPSKDAEALPRYTDIHYITLLNPEFISKTQTVLPAPAPKPAVKK